MMLKNKVSMVIAAGMFSMSIGHTLAFADPPPWAGGKGAQANRGHDHYQITTREQFYISDWYRRHGHKNHTHKLPPGQAKKLYRGAPWPPPFAYAPLPYEVVRGLQPLPPGYRYYQVGADVVIANLAGQVVTDVVYDLLNR